ncbi:hypothetical protein [Aeromonas veronii]|uniref:hypothetical protein n=1 Tax=Aeromonas veronii TaxID=654 RepID=UPI001F0B3239|nr:hypothetical protein [Aeromonas veronii]
MATGRYHWSKRPSGAVLQDQCGGELAVAGRHPASELDDLLCRLGGDGHSSVRRIVKKMSVTAFMRAINVWLTGRVKSTKNLIKELAR